MNGSSHEPLSLTSSTPPIFLPLSKASNCTRIDIFWLPGTRDDSPDGRTPTFAITTPSIENVAARMSSPRESSRIDVKSSSDIHSRTSCMRRVVEERRRSPAGRPALSGGATLDSFCGGRRRRCGSVPHAENDDAAATTIATPHFSFVVIAVSPRVAPPRAYAKHGKTRAVPPRRAVRPFPRPGYGSGTAPLEIVGESKRAGATPRSHGARSPTVKAFCLAGIRLS